MCGKRFARKEHVENHIKLVHEKRKPFECGVCKKKFSQKHHFLSHVSNMHGVQNCTGLMPTERELKLTMQALDKGENVEDNDKFKHSIKSAIKPMQLRTKLNNVPKNSESIDSGEGLEKSLVSVDNNGGVTMTQEQKSEIHHGTVPTTKYNPHVCPFCDQSFKQLPNLGAHIMSAHEPPTGDDPQPKGKNNNKISHGSRKPVAKQKSNKKKRVQKRP